MRICNVAFILAIAFIANAQGNYNENSGENSYGPPQPPLPPPQPPLPPSPPAPSYHGYGGQSYGKETVPYAPTNTQTNTVTSSISYPQNKGEILIHRPAAIVVQRPPTRVVVNHLPLIVKPAPVVLHKQPAVVIRKVFVKQHPRPVKVEPVYVNVVKPPAEKFYVKERQPKLIDTTYPQSIESYKPVHHQESYGDDSYDNVPPPPPPPQPHPKPYGSVPYGVHHNSDDGLPVPAYASADKEGAQSNAGYELLKENAGLEALANLVRGGSKYGVPSSY